jgi:hypothetical protein
MVRAPFISVLLATRIVCAMMLLLLLLPCAGSSEV